MKRGVGRRSSPRIPLEIPVRLGERIGSSRNISRTGIFFTTGHLVEEGENIHFILEFDHILPDKPMHIECQGQVVRIEKKEGILGVAARIVNFQFFN
ncbi:MAG: PilZ domain-containing protein [Desulfuromonadaceae bacterium]|nr:PilZ domain-containing protein [Desulfuromonadaceae bacterium]